MARRTSTYSFMEEAFRKAGEQTPARLLFKAGTDFVDEFLKHAQAAGTISRYFQQKDKEHPVLPHALFYIVGVDDEWRYAHARKGRPRIHQERSHVDYYMHVAMQPDQSIELSFTTSQHAHAAKKMGWGKGVRTHSVRDRAALSSKDTQAFVADLANFLTRHAETLNHKSERRRRTMRSQGQGTSDPQP